MTAVDSEMPALPQEPALTTATHHNVNADSTGFREYLDATLGGTEGWLCAAVGVGGHFDSSGAYVYRDWWPRVYEWPAEADRAVLELTRESHMSDVLVCPYVMTNAARTLGESVARPHVHADVDGDPDYAKLVDLGAFIVSSGRNVHAYIPLTQSVSVHQHQKLEEALREELGTDTDAKIRDNDMLRPVGTFNRKPTCTGGEPAPVTWLIRPNGRRVDPNALASKLGIVLPDAAIAHSAATSAGSVPMAVAAPVDISGYPAVAQAVAVATGDRSNDTMTVVGASYDAGLTLAQTRAVIAGRPDLAQRLSERHDDDVLTCWLKAIDARQDRAWLRTPPGPAADDGTAVDPLEGAIQYQMTLQRTRREATRRLDAEERPPVVPPPVTSLDALLAEPITAARYRIDRLAPEGGRVMVSAQYKAGKSHMVGNVVRSLVDLDPFLGHFDVHGTVNGLALIDDELSRDTVHRWLDEQGIRNTAAVTDVVTLRGKVGSFNLLDDRIRRYWAQRLIDVGCDYLVLDCLRPVLDALGLDENREAGPFLVAFDALLDEAGIPNAMLIHHMGHSNERSRGDSRLQDWPDAIWKIVRETDDPASPRYFSAIGRDVEVSEGRLTLDKATRRLTYAGGSRGDAKTEAAYLAVVALLAGADEPMNSRAVETVLSDAEHPQKAIRAALRLGAERDVLRVADGPNRSKLHSIAYPCAQCGRPVTSRGERHESCAGVK